jgi:hypothetical protein
MVTSRNMVTPLRMVAVVVLCLLSLGDGYARAAGREREFVSVWRNRDVVLKEVQIKHPTSINVRLVLGGRGNEEGQRRETKDGRLCCALKSEAVLGPPNLAYPQGSGTAAIPRH